MVLTGENYATAPSDANGDADSDAAGLRSSDEKLLDESMQEATGGGQNEGLSKACGGPGDLIGVDRNFGDDEDLGIIGDYKPEL